MRFIEFDTLLETNINNIEGAISAFVRLLERHIGEKLFRYGGANGTVEIKGGTGILFLTDSGPAYQFNYIDGSIQSITIWNQFNFRPGDYTLYLNGMNLAQIGQKLVRFVAAPETGKFSIMYESRSTLNEALRRVGPEEFFSLAKRTMRPGQDLEQMSWEEMKDIAVRADVRIPAAAQAVRIQGTKGKNARFDLTQLMNPEFKRPSTGMPVSPDDLPGETPDQDGPNLEHLIMVHPRDPNTKKFMSSKQNVEVDRIIKQVKTGLASPAVQKSFTDENPDDLFRKMQSLVKLVAQGHFKSLIIYGGPGTGKTFTVKQELKEEGLQQNKDWFMVKGRITTPELYKHLYIHRKGKIIVFDDTDSVWNDADAANILKAALDSYDERLVSWSSAKTQNISYFSDEEKEEYYASLDMKLIDEPENVKKYPSEFIYEGRIIFISNLSKEKFDTAVLSRSAAIDMTLSANQMFSRIRGVLPRIGSPDVDMDQKNEILQFLIDLYQQGGLQAPTMRSYVNAESVYRSGMPNWKELFDFLP